MEAMEHGFIDTNERLRVIQMEAAERAVTIGEFQGIFRADAIGLLNEGVDADLVHARIDIIANATKDQTHIAIAKTDANVLGFARVGGGDGGIVLSEQYFGAITTMDDAAEMQHAGAHERRHGNQALLTGGVVFDGDSISALMLYEGDAELFANAEVGMAATEHRDGQPNEVYGEGQSVAYALRQTVGHEIWNRVLTETGDVRELQVALNKADRGNQNAPTVLEGALAG